MSVELDEDYATLSPQELEAIKLNDDGSDPEEVVEEVEEVVDEPTPAPVEPPAEPEVAEEQEDEPVEAAPDSVVRDEVFAPQYQVQGVENFKEVVAQLDAELDTKAADLAAKYESGELSFTDYRKEERALSRFYEDQRQELVKANLKAEIAAEHSRQSSAQKWELEQNLFFSDRAENADYKTDPVLRGALSAQLEVLYADEKNAGKPGIWFLREAGKALDERFNRVTAPTSPQANSKLKETEEMLRKRKASHPDIPKTLASIPTAEENVDNKNEFDWLDKLSGLDLERAMAKMSDTERDRYLAA